MLLPELTNKIPILGVNFACWLSTKDIEIDNANVRSYFLSPEPLVHKYNFPHGQIQISKIDETEVHGNLSIISEFSTTPSRKSDLWRSLEFVYAQSRGGIAATLEDDGTTLIKYLYGCPLLFENGKLCFPRKLSIRLRLSIKSLADLCRGKPSFGDGKYKQIAESIGLNEGDVFPVVVGDRICILQLQKRIEGHDYSCVLFSKVEMSVEGVLRFPSDATIDNSVGVVIA